MPTPQAKPECGHGAIFSHPPPPQSTPATLPRGAWASQTSRGGERVTATPLSHPITPAASERPARLAPPPPSPPTPRSSSFIPPPTSSSSSSQPRGHRHPLSPGAESGTALRSPLLDTHRHVRALGWGREEEEGGVQKKMSLFAPERHRTPQSHRRRVETTLQSAVYQRRDQNRGGERDQAVPRTPPPVSVPQNEEGVIPSIPPTSSSPSSVPTQPPLAEIKAGPDLIPMAA